MVTLKLATGARQDLQIAAMALTNEGVLNEISDVLYFFEKPWKYQSELEDLKFEVEV